MLLSILIQRLRYSLTPLPTLPRLPLNGLRGPSRHAFFVHIFYQLFHANTYELPETQWAAVTTHLSEINDPPQINPPYLFSATC